MTSPETTSPARRLVEELDDLHAFYVHAINEAVAGGRPARVAELAAGYDRDAVRLVAEREGRTDLLPLFEPAPQPSTLVRLRRLVGLVTRTDAAQAA